MTATFSLVEDRTAVDRHVLQMYSTCLTCITAGIWHKEALSQNQQQQQRKQCHVTRLGRRPLFRQPLFRHFKMGNAMG